MEETVPKVRGAADVTIVGLMVSLNRMEVGLGGKVSALEEIKERYGFPTSAIVSMADVVEHLYNKECEGKVVIDYAQEQLGDIVFVDIPTEGETLAADEVFGTIEVVKTISDLFLPVTGEILEQNEALADQPELVNQDPYGEGWLIKIKPAADADFDSLLDAEAYKALINE